MKKKEVKAKEVLDILDILEKVGIDVWLDGGWGVDALLKKQTRFHKDVDVIVSVNDVNRVKAIFGEKGFKLVKGGILTSFTLRDKSGKEIDVHAVRFDKKGNGVYQMKNGKDWIYPAEGFTGKGKVGNREVKCLTAKTQILCHAGYKLAKKDYDEMKALHEQFRVDYPEEYKNRF